MTEFQFSAPDLTEKIIGVRGFYYVNPEKLGVWVPGVNVAFCRGKISLQHEDIPVVGCGCGLYAYYDQDHFSRMGVNYGPIWAAVVGWGKVVLTQDGWRAQYAEIVALAMSSLVYTGKYYSGAVESMLDGMAEKYEVPLVKDYELHQEALKHGSPVPKSLIPLNAPQKYWNEYLAYTYRGVIPDEIPPYEEIQAMSKSMQYFYERVQYIKDNWGGRIEDYKVYKTLYPNHPIYPGTPKYPGRYCTYKKHAQDEN